MGFGSWRVKVARLALGVAVGVSAVAAVPGAARASSSAWYQTYQVNTSGSFSDIAAISKTNIWAVGDLFDKKGNTIYQPFIRHDDGSGWKTVTLPGSPKFASDQVSASAANDVWIFGSTSSSVSVSVAYRYDGSHWHKIPVPAETFLADAVALGPKNVWAIGSSATLFPPGGSTSATIFHWNGVTWRGYNLDNGNLMPESISASGADNVWIAGSAWTANQALAYRWNGTGWHRISIPRVPTDIPSVTVFSPSNVWIGWDTATASHATHWDGHQWHTLTPPGNVIADTGNIVPDGKGGLWFGCLAILVGSRWTSLPPIRVSGGFASLVRIPGTESFLQPATVKISNSSPIQRPTLYRFDL